MPHSLSLTSFQKILGFQLKEKSSVQAFIIDLKVRLLNSSNKLVVQTYEKDSSKIEKNIELVKKLIQLKFCNLSHERKQFWPREIFVILISNLFYCSS